MVTVSPSGPPGLFKGVTTATSGVLARFPLLLPVRNHTVQDSSRGRRKGVVPRTPPDRATRHGNRGVVTRARLGDLKENWFLLFPIQQCQHAHPLAMILAICSKSLLPIVRRTNLNAFKFLLVPASRFSKFAN